LKESQVGQVSRMVYKPMVMFALGAAITMVSMSVSVSLSILVPLSNRGIIRRENVIPYIMGQHYHFCRYTTGCRLVKQSARVYDCARRNVEHHHRVGDYSKHNLSSLRAGYVGLCGMGYPAQSQLGNLHDHDLCHTLNFNAHVND